MAAVIQSSRARALARRLRRLSDPFQAKVLQSFFKTGPGEYAEGDRFVGVKVPVVRRLVREYAGMPPEEASELVRSSIHEERLAGLLLWVESFKKGDDGLRARIFDLYRSHAPYINNWDLVDLSAPTIVGEWLRPEDWRALELLAQSPSLWERRTSVLATFAWIRRGTFSPTLRLCEKLMTERHDLMHKCCGWMLREIGKRDRGTLRAFLDQHAGVMPRTMLRYALEHFAASERQLYMAMKSARLNGLDHAASGSSFARRAPAPR